MSDERGDAIKINNFDKNSFSGIINKQESVAKVLVFCITHTI